MLAEIIQTERIVLRPFRSTDVDDVFGYAADPEWNVFSTRMRGAYARADAVAFVATQMALDPAEQTSLAIEQRGAVIGSIRVLWLFDHRVAEISFGIARSAWGQGLATEASQTVISAAFKAFPQLIRFRARCDARNARSIRVMSKLGMTREGFLRSDRMVRGELVDEVIYGVLRREWTSRC
jgi:ribosomal-protein-alanine N-acetyltransferase